LRQMVKVCLGIIVGIFALLISTSSAQAQWVSLGVRGSGSVPTGAFAEESSSTSSTAVIEGAKNGFGYGLDIAAGIGMFGVYGGFDHVNFDCETYLCSSGGEYTLSGASAGLKLTKSAGLLLHPFIKGGVTFNKLRGRFGSSSDSGLTSDRAPGYEVGVGVDLNLLGLLALAPQVRYVGQNFKAKVPGVTSPDPDGQGVNYFTFDLGLAVQVPFGPFSGRVRR
jgi:hypothetical protein